MRARARHAVCVLAAVLMLVVGLPGPTRATGAPAPKSQSVTYENPLVNGQTAHPFIVKDGNTYYAYFSGLDFFGSQNVPTYQSTDLVSWSQLSPLNVLPSANAGAWADTSSGKNFSSPSVLHVPNNPASSRWVLYFTGTHGSSGESCIGVATSDSAAGPFVGADEPLICPGGGAQDPSPLPLGDDPPYQQLVYSTEGAIYNQVLSPDGLSLNSGLQTPYLLYEAAPTWWHDGVVRRPAVTADGDDIYLFFSGGQAGTRDSATGWSPCRQVFGVVYSCDQQTSFGTWVTGNDNAEDVSGVQVFRDGDQQWITYHARPSGSCSGSTCTGNPTMRIDKLCFNYAHPRTNAPSTTPQDLQRDADCSADIPGVPLSVEPVTDDSVMSQPGNVIFRDGGASVPLDGRVLWLFSDTLMSGCPSLSNTAALGVPHAGATGPHWSTEPVDGNGCLSPAFPYTDDESDFNADPPGPGWRVALWEGGGIPLPDGDALVFFTKFIAEGCGLCLSYQGTGAVRVPSGSTVADRDAAVSPVACNPTCLFTEELGIGFARPFIADDYVYVVRDARMARAPLASVEDPAAWRFWTDDPSGPWTADPELIADVPGALDPTNPQSCGLRQVAYNPHLDRFLNVHCDYADFWNPEGRSRMMVQVAERPEGPWESKLLAYDTAQMACETDSGGTAWPYSLLQAGSLSMDGGQTVTVAYARPRGPGCSGQMRLVTLHLG